jgi:hypothetical protein
MKVFIALDTHCGYEIVSQHLHLNVISNPAVDNYEKI